MNLVERLMQNPAQGPHPFKERLESRQSQATELDMQLATVDDDLTRLEEGAQKSLPRPEDRPVVFREYEDLSRMGKFLNRLLVK